MDLGARESEGFPSVGRELAGADGDGSDPGAEAGLDVARAVTDHRALGGIEVVLSDHLLNVARRGFTVERGLVGCLRCDADAGEEG